VPIDSVARRRCGQGGARSANATPVTALHPLGEPHEDVSYDFRAASSPRWGLGVAGLSQSHTRGRSATGSASAGCRSRAPPRARASARRGRSARCRATRPSSPRGRPFLELEQRVVASTPGRTAWSVALSLWPARSRGAGTAGRCQPPWMSSVSPSSFEVHHRALDVPAGPAAAPRAVDCNLRRTRPAWPPSQGEVRRVVRFLSLASDPRPGFELLRVAVAQLAVVGVFRPRRSTRRRRPGRRSPCRSAGRSSRPWARGCVRSPSGSGRCPWTFSFFRHSM